MIGVMKRRGNSQLFLLLHEEISTSKYTNMKVEVLVAQSL